MELSPEERQRIYEEEHFRVEARAQIEKAEKERQQRQEREQVSQRTARSKKFAKKLLVIGGVSLALATVVIWKIATASRNGLRQAEHSIGNSPSDELWKVSF
jgi:hypothetical protein